MDAKPMDIAKLAVASFGLPAYAGHVNALLNAVGGNQNTAQHWLAKAGLKKSMLRHAATLKRLGRHDERRHTMRQVGQMFGNSTR